MATFCQLCEKKIGLFDGIHHIAEVLICDKCYAEYVKVLNSVSDFEAFDKTLDGFQNTFSGKENTEKIVASLKKLHEEKIQEIEKKAAKEKAKEKKCNNTEEPLIEENDLSGVKKINIPAYQRKKTTIASNLYYDTLEIYNNKVVGYLDGHQTMTWYFKDYFGIDFVKANMNSQFAQIVFLTGMNSKNRALGIDFGATQNLNAVKDTNRILFCSGMFSFGDTNEFANSVANEIRKAFENYKDVADVVSPSVVSVADELLKLKQLLDIGVLTQEEFDDQKKKILNK